MSIMTFRIDQRVDSNPDIMITQHNRQNVSCVQCTEPNTLWSNIKESFLLCNVR